MSGAGDAAMSLMGFVEHLTHGADAPMEAAVNQKINPVEAWRRGGYMRANSSGAEGRKQRFPKGGSEVREGPASWEGLASL